MTQATQASNETQWAQTRYNGHVVYLFAFDVAYEMTRQNVGQLMGHPVALYEAGPGKPGPEQLFFYRPQMLRLTPVEQQGPHGPVRLEWALKLFPVGAISLSVRVPFTGLTLGELVEYHDLHLGNGTLLADVRRLAQQVLTELKPYLVRPVSQVTDEEVYTVFSIDAACIEPPAEGWLAQNRREVAALLTQESHPQQLSRQEFRESTQKYLSYYRDDLVVIDWDAALVIEQPGNVDEILHVMELANVQLVELEAYDRFLDEAIDRSYRDLSERMLRGRREVLDSLREIRIDLARLSDELSNITKFFGDWHLARIFQSLSARFHLDDWHRVIDEKLKTLDDLYQLHKQEQTNRVMMILEVSIVLMFVLDLIILLIGLKK